jgi:glycosyltransferase involved in cell wall biosynthesis
MAESLLQNYQLLINYAVIPNGRDRRPFFKGRKHPRIFSCGRIWDEAKNFLLLDRAAPAVQWPIEIAGDSQSEANTIGLRHLQSLGRLGVRQLADRFAQASIFVLPALYEPFGLSPLEAAWSGCALVLGDLASLREVWGAAAIFVSPHDPEELCAQLNRLTRDLRLREEMAARAFARAGAFSPEKMTASYLVAYQTCLTTKGMEVAA